MNDQSGNTTAPLVKALAGASFGLGLAELVAPRKVAAVAGVDDTRLSRRVIRALGARECGHGAALLGGSDKLVWTRVAGDVLDVAPLVAGVAARGRGRRRQGAISAAALGGIANAPVGRPLQWDAQITEDQPNKRIAWQSLPGSAIHNGGSIEFTPASDGDGTEVRVRIGYQMPGGVVGKAAATLFGESPDQQVNDDLRRFKQILETGQVLRSDGSPDGTAAARQLHQQPAQPSGHTGNSKGATA